MTARRRNRATAVRSVTPWYALGGLFLPPVFALLARGVEAGPNAWIGLLAAACALGAAALVLRQLAAPDGARRGVLRISRSGRQALAAAASAGGFLLAAALLWLRLQEGARPAVDAGSGWTTADAAAIAGAFLLFAAAAVQASLLPRTATWDRRRLGARELNFVVLLSLAAYFLLLASAAWMSPVAAPAAPGALAGEPQAAMAPRWLIAAAAAGAATYFGLIALKVLRRPGVAVMVFAAALCYHAIGNFVLFQRTGAEASGAPVYFVATLAAFVMDAVYMVRVYAAEDSNTLWFAITAAELVTAVTVLLFLPAAAGDPSLDANTITSVISGTILAGLGGGWCGEQAGRLLGAACAHV